MRTWHSHRGTRYETSSTVRRLRRLDTPRAEYGMKVRIPRLPPPWRARRELEEDLARELEIHFDLAREEHRERGLSRAAATDGAQRQLGSITHVREEMREMWGWIWLQRNAPTAECTAPHLAEGRKLPATHT